VLFLIGVTYAQKGVSSETLRYILLAIGSSNFILLIYVVIIILLKQFMGIKVGLHIGTDLPMEFNIKNVEEMMPLSDITIYYSNDKIIFIIHVPLVYQHELTLFQLIPIPNYDQNNCL